jgi:hypothetical protein
VLVENGFYLMGKIHTPEEIRQKRVNYSKAFEYFMEKRLENVGNVEQQEAFV